MRSGGHLIRQADFGRLLAADVEPALRAELGRARTPTPVSPTVGLTSSIEALGIDAPSSCNDTPDR